MDQVNRRISMQMMTDTAKVRRGPRLDLTLALADLGPCPRFKEADATQFILITPQSVNSSSFRWGPEVRVFKMRDPERGQGEWLPSSGLSQSPDADSVAFQGTLAVGHA